MDAPIYRSISRIAFGDTDASGWMHFPQIFRYVEDAEHQFLSSIGINVFDLHTGGWPRAHVSCDYKRPLKAGDSIDVLLNISHIGSSSITWVFEVLNPSGSIAATGTITTVRVNTEGKSQAISDADRAALNAAIR